MDTTHAKLLQYLDEARATERGLERVLESQIAMTPHGDYRDALEAHLDETRGHAAKVDRRLDEIGAGRGAVTAVVGLAETAVGQAVALAKTPLDLLRGGGGAEKVLKNAKDTAASEALEIASYGAIEQLANELDDETTAELAASIREEEQRMLDRVLELIPSLTRDVVGGSYDASTTGAAEVLRAAGRAATRQARQARRVPGVARAEGEAKGAVASEEDLAIGGYDDLNASEVTARLGDLSQVDLAKVDAYERRNGNRSTVLDRIRSLRGDEPWPGYDEQNVGDVEAELRAGDEDLARKVLGYERAHKNRSGVNDAAERHTTAST